MDKIKIVEILNKARVEELTSISQYMQHHYLAKGMNSPEIGELFKELGLTEMKHAYRLAERIVALGGKPTLETDPIKVPDKLVEMIKANLEVEYIAIKKYKEFIKDVSDDITTRNMLEDILADEEEIASKLEQLLGD